MVPGSRNCLQVIDEIQAIRSPSSVSGFRFNFTIRLPGGNFLQVLKSFSPISWLEPVTPGPVPPGVPVPVPVPAAAPAGGVVAGVGVGVVPAPGGVRGFPFLPPNGPGRPGTVRGMPGVVAGAEPGGGGPTSPGLTLTGLPSGPVTTAARRGLVLKNIATNATAATRSFVRLFIG